MQRYSVQTRGRGVSPWRGTVRGRQIPWVSLVIGASVFGIDGSGGASAFGQNLVGSGSSPTINRPVSCNGNGAPIADAGEDRDVIAGQAVEFSGAASADATGAIRTYRWNFGDGSMGEGLSIQHTYAESGDYEVTLTVTDQCGASDQASFLARVSEGGVAGGDCTSNQTPTANAGPDQQGAPSAVLSFNGSNSSDPDGAITSYWWNFGDGQFTGWQPNAIVTHSYAAPGTYTARLWARDNCQVFSPADQAVVSISGNNPCANNAGPSASAGSDRTVQVNQSVAFSAAGSTDGDGTITGYSWNFGDGQSGSGSSVSHTYASSGNFTATLTVTDNCGSTASDSAIVTVSASNSCSGNQTPVPNAGADQQGATGVPVTLNGSGSSDANGNIQEYWWNFGDGQYTGWQGSAIVTHNYSSQGNFNARLWVRDSCGAMSMSDTAIVAVSNGSNPCNNNQAPIANAGPDKTGTAGIAVSFSGNGSSDGNGTITSYSWNFGDGQTGGGVSASHAYATAGAYTVTLTVTDNCGATAQDSAGVVISPSNPCSGNNAPFANAGSDQNGVAGTALSFSGAGSTDINNNITGYSWDFGDGQSATGVGASHAFASAGTYSVILTVNDACGASDTDTMSVVIAPSNPCANNTPPVANAGPDRSVATGTPVTFSAAGSSDSTGQITSYWWNFGDGQSTGWQSSGTVQHTYTTAQTFTASLWVRDNCNVTSALDTALITVTSSNPCSNNTPPTANAGPDRTAQTGVAITFNGGGSTDAGGMIQSYAWNFGNGQSGSGVSPTHTYAAAGTYSVTLTVTDNCGAPHSDQATVTVSAPPSSSLDAQFKVYKLVSVNTSNGNEQWVEINPASETVELGTKLKYDASFSSGTIGFASWQLGDGSYASGLQVNYLYEDIGTYPVELTVFDPSWANHDVLTRNIQVDEVMNFLDALPLADDNSNDIAVDGNLAWTSHFNGKLTTINISNPSAMQVLSTITAPVSRAIAASNGHVYLCATGAGVQIYQGTTPTPTYVTTYNTSAQDGQNARDAIAMNKVLFLAAGAAGLKAVNVTNAASPVALGARVLPGNASAEALIIAGGRAYVSDNASKVHILDVSMFNVNNPSPGTPTLLKTIHVGWLVQQLAISGNTLIAMASPGGMFLYDVSNPSDPNANQVGFLDIAAEAYGISPGGIIAVGNRIYAGFGTVLSIGTSVARISIVDPSEPYVMEWLSMSPYQVSGINRGPVLHNGVLFFANSTYKAAAVDIP